MTRILIGGVGYRQLRDFSFGVALVDQLGAMACPAVAVEDISYNPIAVVQRLKDEPPFDLAIIAGALQRPGRAPGTLEVYRWDNNLPGPAAIHEAVTEAVTGIIALDNTLILARHFQALPDTVVVVELEPDAHEFGDTLTPAVASALERARTQIELLVANPSLARSIRSGSLAVHRPRHTGVVFRHIGNNDSTIH